MKKPTNKNRSKNKTLIQTRPKLINRYSICFVVVVALVGGYWLYKGFAASGAPYSRLDCTPQTHNQGESSVQACYNKSIEGASARAFVAVLGRQPDTKSLQYWSNVYNSYGLSGQQVVLEKILQSSEAKRKFVALANDQKQIAYLYQTILGRQPDAKGIAYWEKRYKNDSKWSRLIAAFLNTNESLNKLQQPTFETLNKLPGNWRPKGAVTKDSISNWSGYAVTEKKFTLVEGRARVPSVKCKSKTDAVTVWVGLSGYYGDTVEQIGFTGDCTDVSNFTDAKPIDGVTYYAWAMLFGAGAYDDSALDNLRIKPGDTIYQKVEYVGNSKYELTMKNETTNEAREVTYKCVPDDPKSTTACARHSAEWIVERPGNSSLATFDDLKLYDNRAVADGRSYSPYNLQAWQIDMVQGDRTLATASDLNVDGSFDVKWDHTGIPGE